MIWSKVFELLGHLLLAYNMSYKAKNKIWKSPFYGHSPC